MIFMHILKPVELNFVRVKDTASDSGIVQETDYKCIYHLVRLTVNTNNLRIILISYNL